MSDAPVSFSRARKARLRAEAKKVADSNAVKFGRSKAERVLAATRGDKARAMLDAHKCSEE